MRDNKWRIQSGTDFFTGQPKWKTVPPRFAYGPRAGRKRSHDTYDEALAHVRTSTGGRRPIVFESKTRIGEWFWLTPDGQSGWAEDRDQAQALAETVAVTA